jgi:hypothetical protein
MGEADQELRFRLIADASQEIQEMIRVREATKKMTEEILDYGRQAKITFKDVAQGLINLKAEELKATTFGAGGKFDAALEQLKASQKYKDVAGDIGMGVSTKQAKMESDLRKQYIKDDKDALSSYAAEVKRAYGEIGKTLLDTNVLATQASKERSASEIANIKGIEAAQKEYLASYKNGNVVMTDAAKQQGAILTNLATQIKSTAEATGQSYAQVATQMVQTGTPINTVNNAMKLLGDETKKTSEGFKLFGLNLGQIGNIAKVVMTSLFGVYSIVQLLRLGLQFFKDASQSAYELAKGIFQVSIGVRALQRAGGDITIKDLYENIDKLKEKFGIFSRKELIQGSAALINLIRDFGLTSKQILGMQDAIATLAVVNGRAMDEVQRTVALALSSGYTEGLQRLGVSINRTTIALEAQRLGWGRNYMSLTEQQRALATYNLIIAKTAKYAEDLVYYQTTLPGRMDKATASIIDQTAALGKKSLPVVVALKEAWAGVLEEINKIYETILRSMALNKAYELGLIEKEPAWYFKLTPGYIPTPGLDPMEKERKLAELRQYMKDIGLIVDEGLGNIKPYADPFAEAWKGIEARREPLLALADELNTMWKDITTQRDEKLLAIQSRYDEEMLNIQTQYNQKAEDIEREYAQRMIDIEINKQKDIQDAWRKYYQDIADVNRKANQDIEDANRKYREGQLQAEKDLAKELRRLREDLLMNLEDAIRERDAKQAMRLIRSYNVQRGRTIEDAKDAEAERKKALQWELADIERQRKIRLAELKRTLNQQLAEINLNYQRELETLNLWRKREYEDRELWLKREHDQAKLARDRAYKDEQKWWNDQINLMSRRMRDYGKIFATDLTWLYGILKGFIGSDGVMRQLWTDYYNFLAAQAAATWSGITVPQSIGGHTIPGMASGGTLLATRPTAAIFGERGAEYATFTPANKAGQIGGRIAIEMLLSPDLEARIIDNTLGEMADVVLSIQRSK